MLNKLAYTYEIYIGAPVDRVWAGLIDGDITKNMSMELALTVN